MQIKMVVVALEKHMLCIGMSRGVIVWYDQQVRKGG